MKIRVHGGAAQATDVKVIRCRKDAICCRLAKARPKTNTHNIKFLFIFYWNSGYGNALHLYGIVHSTCCCVVHIQITVCESVWSDWLFVDKHILRVLLCSHAFQYISIPLVLYILFYDLVGHGSLVDMCWCVFIVWVCVCVCVCFGNMYTVLWLRFYLPRLTFFLSWLRFFRAFSSVVRQMSG
jgi:hypothetical protein